MWSNIKVRVDFWRGGIVCKWWECLCAGGAGGAGLDGGIRASVGVAGLCTARDRRQNPQLH